MLIDLPFSAAARSFITAAALQHSEVPATDSVVVDSPLPGGIAQVVRFLLNTVPPWLQVGGLIVAAVVAVAITWFIITRRSLIRTWFIARSRRIQLTLMAAALLLVVGVVSTGAATWNYTQHSNDFCVGCHIMNPAFQKFSTDKNKHADLSCHDCHTQSLGASARQLFVWISERPQDIGEHAKVSNTVCEKCHVTADTAKWQRVAATAGHRVHLESDSASLKNLQCVTCHGVDLHRFQPADKTCGQSGCHDVKDTRITLGKMAGQTVRHCTSCHEFTADVPALATTDSARTTLIPGKPQCLGCHEMQKLLADFDEKRDPHNGTCGMCHNPHVQKTPKAAAESCATSGCHSEWRKEPFHAGANHRQVAQQCLTCHQPHSAKVDASGCESCHRRVREGSSLRPPLPFDTAAALRRSELPPPEGSFPSGAFLHLKAAQFSATTVRPEVEFVRSGIPPAADSFPHSRHTRIACMECHETGDGHGRLTFERPRGCAICHHQAASQAQCSSCHRAQQYTAPKQVTVTVTVAGHQPNPRSVDFLHSTHSGRACTECHTTPVTLEPGPGKAQCRDCHDSHHDVDRTCATCHKIAQPKAAHKTVDIAHQRCDACHKPATVAMLTPTRTLCSTCHTEKAKDHYDGRECSTCHMLAKPEVYRARIVTPPA